MAFLTTLSKVYTTIRQYHSLEVRYMDFKIIDYDENILLFSNEFPLYLKISKILEYRYTTGVYDSIVTCIKGNYKKIISIASDGNLKGNELDPYLISKEEWDKAVEETYKNYEEIIEL